MELKLTLATLAIACVAAITPNEQAQILCASIIGSALGGYMGSMSFRGEKNSAHQALSFRKRWAANLAFGSCAGPMVTAHYAPMFPDMPILFLALAAGGILGGFGVVLLTIFFPFIIQWIKNRISPPLPPPSTKD